MYRFYTPVLLLQIFCVYHAYTKKQESKWIYIILFFPLIGSIIYLYKAFYSRNSIENLKEGIKSSINTNHKIEMLEKEVAFSDSITNKTRLADEYVSLGNFDRAHDLYDSCLHGIHKNDIHLLMRLVKVNYLRQDYQGAISYGNQLIHVREFNNSEEKAALAWSLYHTGMLSEAKKYFEELDISYTNYTQRLEYAKYLEQAYGPELAKAKTEEMLSEIESMGSYERKLNRSIYRIIRDYYSKF